MGLTPQEREDLRDVTLLYYSADSGTYSGTTLFDLNGNYTKIVKK